MLAIVVFYVVISNMTNETNNMSAYIKQPLNAANVKKGMKAYGIDVLRCRSNKEGVLVTVKKSSVNLAINFFNEFGLSINPSTKPSFNYTSLDYVDFGTLFKFVECGR